MADPEKHPLIPVRAWLALLALLGITPAALGAVTLNPVVDVLAGAGANHDFNLQVAASDRAHWTPSDSDWEEGNPVALALHRDERPLRLLPGEQHTFFIAVRNASPRLTSSLALRLLRADTADVSEGGDLFSALRFVISADGELLTAQEGEEPMLIWPRNLAPGEVVQFELSVGLPASAGNELMGASANVVVRADGASE